MKVCTETHVEISSSPFFVPFQNLKKNVDERQATLTQAKGEYKTALRNLEMISDEIHERRRNSTIGPRECGVGAEGNGVSGDEIASFKMESEGISSEFSTLIFLFAQTVSFYSDSLMFCDVVLLPSTSPGDTVRFMSYA